MSTDRHYAAISFDVGYTLIQPLSEAPAIVAAVLGELGLVPDAAALAGAHQRAERLFLSDYLRPLNDTWEADERINRLYLRYYGQWLAEFGIEDPESGHAQIIIDRYLDPANWRLYPHVLETLAVLHDQGYRLGVASDWVSGLPRILRALGLSRYLDWAVVSGAIGFAKPSPQFYRLVVQRAGVAPERIVHVGDSYYADVRGARTVGMDVILLDWQRRSWPKLDVSVIHDIAALPQVLDEYAVL
jgi:putative hydrolase of the HAD superfamily